MFKPVKSLPSESTRTFNWSMIVLAILVFYSAAITTVGLFKGSNKIAYVNSGDLLKKYKGAIEANKKFDDESKKWEGNIKTLQSELDSLNFLFVKEGNNWSLERKKQMAGFAKKREEDLQRYTQAVQQKASARQQELLQPVLADVNNVVTEYAKKEGYDMILGTTDGNIVYASDATNVTDKVLAILNK